MSLFFLFTETAFKITCVLAAAALANVLWRRRSSAASRHLVWTLAVAGLLVLPVLSALLPRWDVEVPIGASNAAVASPLPEAIGRADVAGTAPVTESHAGVTAAASVEAPFAAPIGRGVAWLALLPGLYVAGVLLLLIRLVHERWMVRRLAQRARVMDATDPEWTPLLFECATQIGVRRPVRLLRSLERSMPLAFGIREPSILVPSLADTWSEDRRRAVLLHELAHIARHDCLTQLMAAAACAVYWMHPGVWWMARRLRVERELACDDRVIRAGAHAREYAGHLLELAYTLGGCRAPALVVAMARARQVEGRMLAVLDAGRNRTAPAFRIRLAGVAIAAVLLVPLAAAQGLAVPAKTAGPGAANRDAIALADEGLPGTWEIRATETAPVVYLRLRESTSSSHGSTIPVEQLQGLAPALLSGAGGAAKFSIRRDAGALAFEGTFKSGVGAGTYTFSPSVSFADELAKRGFARPTAAGQYLLARGGVGLAFLDELTTQRYARPDLPQLVRAAEHGVDLAFIRELSALGYRFGQIDALIAQRDHGVSAAFIRELAAQGLKGLTADDLIRARDHGVSAQYVAELKALGHGPLSLDALVAAREHGISPAYVRDLRRFGYQLTLAELTAAREHGVSPEYIRDMAALGYQRMTLGDLIAAREQGISPEYVRELRDVGYQLTIDELTRAREHGVSADDVRRLKAQGRTGLSLEDLVAMKNRGPQVVVHDLRPGGIMFFAHYHMRAIERWFRNVVEHWPK